MKRIEQSEIGQLPHFDNLSAEQKSMIKGVAVFVLAEYIAKNSSENISVDTAIKYAITMSMAELKDEGSL